MVRAMRPVMPTVSSGLFSTSSRGRPCLLHVGMHWGWYRTLAKGVGSKSRLTLLLSLLFAVAVATGIGLLLSRGGHQPRWGSYTTRRDSSWGLWPFSIWGNGSERFFAV